MDIIDSKSIISEKCPKIGLKNNELFIYKENGK